MAIQSILGFSPELSSTAAKTTTGEAGASFSNILNDAIQNAVQTETSNQANTSALLSGVDTELHTSMIEVQKAELALNLAVQIRNKVVDAYNEIMRMQV